MSWHLLSCLHFSLLHLECFLGGVSTSNRSWGIVFFYELQETNKGWHGSVLFFSQAMLRLFL